MQKVMYPELIDAFEQRAYSTIKIPIKMYIKEHNRRSTMKNTRHSLRILLQLLYSAFCSHQALSVEQLQPPDQ